MLGAGDLDADKLGRWAKARSADEAGRQNC
jgi:hypothetical protein